MCRLFVYVIAVGSWLRLTLVVTMGFAPDEAPPPSPYTEVKVGDAIKARLLVLGCVLLIRPSRHLVCTPQTQAPEKLSLELKSLRKKNRLAIRELSPLSFLPWEKFHKGLPVDKTLCRVGSYR